MDRLYRQIRARPPNPQKKDENSQKKDEGEVNGTKEGHIPPQKTVSFKGERKVSWFQRQSSGQMSPIDEESNGEFAIAIAAATYAINFLGSGDEEKERAPYKKKPVDGLQASLTEAKIMKEGSISKPPDVDGQQAPLTKTKSKKEGTISKPTDSSRVSRWLSGREERGDGESAGEIPATNLEATKKKTLEDPTLNQTKPGREMVTVPSFKSTQTFTDKHPNAMGSTMFASERAKTTGENAPPAVKPKTSTTNDHKLNSTSGQKETKADAWEKAEMEKITKRYEKLYSRILEWENEKKKRAKRRLDRKEGKLELRRKIVSQEYHNEMARIDKIVGGARATTNEKKRIEEHKTMEKANEIRSTGKISHACFCI
uniref:Uncharacterized protein At3g61260 n=1 Tax=Anthurium amnicola TaxID=1678845 RepID=A0A1D1YSH2_9ARAE